MRPSEGPFAYPASSHSAPFGSAGGRLRRRPLSLMFGATQSAVPLCSRSQTVIAASINTDGVLGTHRSAQSPQTAGSPGCEDRRG